MRRVEIASATPFQFRDAVRFERLQHDLAVGPIEEVTFVQLSSNGREIRLQQLSEGMRVQVLKLSLPEDSSFEPDREERKEVFVE